MSRAARYIEAVSVVDDNYSDGETVETVTISEAIIACKLQELDTLNTIEENTDNSFLEVRRAQLEKELRNIKIK